MVTPGGLAGVLGDQNVSMINATYPHPDDDGGNG
jgi:hypothetical protein